MYVALNSEKLESHSKVGDQAGDFDRAPSGKLMNFAKLVDVQQSTFQLLLWLKDGSHCPPPLASWPR